MTFQMSIFIFQATRLIWISFRNCEQVDLSILFLPFHCRVKCADMNRTESISFIGIWRFAPPQMSIRSVECTVSIIAEHAMLRYAIPFQIRANTIFDIQFKMICSVLTAHCTQIGIHVVWVVRVQQCMGKQTAFFRSFARSFALFKISWKIE